LKGEIDIVLEDSKAFSGFAAADIAKVKEFYSKTLSLNVTAA